MELELFRCLPPKGLSHLADAPEASDEDNLNQPEDLVFNPENSRPPQELQIA